MELKYYILTFLLKLFIYLYLFQLYFKFMKMT